MRRLRAWWWPECAGTAASWCRGVSQGRCWDAVALQDPPDRRGADPMAELEHLALEPQASQRGFLPRHPCHQRGNDIVNRRPSGPVRVGPSSAHEAPMPAQDRVRGDQAMATQGWAQPCDEGGEYGPPGPSADVG